MDIEVVIGANYGDEGKGLTTEFCCRRHANPIVVLSNGGCQRGHTVSNVEKGIQHVFHHFGSGTLFGVPSVYSKTFLLNPIKYNEEKKELESKGIKPIAFRAPSCVLQLPSDMFTNQMIEKARGLGKHGSCGWGIWETKVRNRDYFQLTFEQFASFDFKKKKSICLDCLEWQIENRLRGVDKSVFYEELHYIRDANFIMHFIKDFEEMADNVTILDNDNLLETNLDACGFDVEVMIVENAQGLLLDKKYAPKDENGRTDIHSTPSKCGLEGALEALGEDVPLDDVSTFYVSRTYLTRHGNGPFPEEDTSINFTDKTNVYNEYQGNIRFGSFSIDAIDKLLNRINIDGSSSRINVVLTHCNEIDGQFIKKCMKCPVYCSFDNNSKNFYG